MIVECSIHEAKTADNQIACRKAIEYWEAINAPGKVWINPVGMYGIHYATNGNFTFGIDAQGNITE